MKGRNEMSKTPRKTNSKTRKDFAETADKGYILRTLKTQFCKAVGNLSAVEEVQVWTYDYSRRVVEFVYEGNLWRGILRTTSKFEAIAKVEIDFTQRVNI